jgi:hypothetical protein
MPTAISRLQGSQPEKDENRRRRLKAVGASIPQNGVFRAAGRVFLKNGVNRSVL